MRSDPREANDLVEARKGDLGRYRKALGKVFGAPVLERATTPAIGGELLENIKSLGYAGTGDPLSELPNPLAPSDLPSPQSMAQEQVQNLKGLEMLSRGMHAQAQQIFERILRDNPENYFALDRLSNCLILQGKTNEAIAPLQKLLRDGPPWPGSYFNLGECLRVAGRTDEAVGAYVRAVELDPGQHLFREALVLLLRELGRDEEADRYAREPKDPR